MRAIQQRLLVGEQQAGEVDLGHPAAMAQAQPPVACAHGELRQDRGRVGPDQPSEYRVDQEVPAQARSGSRRIGRRCRRPGW